MRVALASFGQMLLREGAVWAARKVQTGKVRPGRGRGRASRLNPAIAPLFAEGARFLETQWNEWLATRTGSRSRPGAATRRPDAAVVDSAPLDAADEPAAPRRRRKARRKK